MSVRQTVFQEATTLETIQKLEEASAQVFGALRRNALQQQAQDAGAAEYDSWAGAIEYESWSAPRR